MDYTTLQAELRDAAYADLTDQAAADALNAATVQRARAAERVDQPGFRFGFDRALARGVAHAGCAD